MLLLIVLIIVIALIIGIAWRRSYNAKLRRKRIDQLRRWAAAHNALESPLQEWIQRLPAADAQTLLGLLDGYCTSLNWELNWLFAPQLKKAPELKLVLEESVSAYVRAILHSLQMEADVVAYQAYVAFEKKPTARKQRPLVQQLYQKVNDERLTPPTKRWFGRVTHKKASTNEKVAAIHRAFERDPAHAMAALKEVLSAEAAVIAVHVQRELHPPVTLAAAAAA